MKKIDRFGQKLNSLPFSKYAFSDFSFNIIIYNHNAVFDAVQYVSPNSILNCDELSSKFSG